MPLYRIWMILHVRAHCAKLQIIYMGSQILYGCPWSLTFQLSIKKLENCKMKHAETSIRKFCTFLPEENAELYRRLTWISINSNRGIMRRFGIRSQMKMNNHYITQDRRSLLIFFLHWAQMMEGQFSPWPLLWSGQQTSTLKICASIVCFIFPEEKANPDFCCPSEQKISTDPTYMQLWVSWGLILKKLTILHEPFFMHHMAVVWQTGISMVARPCSQTFSYSWSVFLKNSWKKPPNRLQRFGIFF